MHYFKLHINDYAQATAHLTLVEDAVYNRLLRKYYADEKPLPSDIERLQRLVGARSREEKEAVQIVLAEFFFRDGDFFRNKRADEELADYAGKSLKAKESANARWMRTHSERTADAKPTQSEGNANHKPITNKDIYPPEFIEFWAAYPRKDGKYAAYKKWQVVSKSFPAEMIRDKAAAYASERTGQDPKFTLLAETWINKRRFLDVVPQRRQSLNALAG